MRCKVSDLVVGSIFRFIDQPLEFVVIGIGFSGVYFRPINYNLGTSSKFLQSFITVDIPPYEATQLSLF